MRSSHGITRKHRENSHSGTTMKGCEIVCFGAARDACRWWNCSDVCVARNSTNHIMTSRDPRLLKDCPSKERAKQIKTFEGQTRGRQRIREEESSQKDDSLFSFRSSFPTGCQQLLVPTCHPQPNRVQSKIRPKNC